MKPGDLIKITHWARTVFPCDKEPEDVGYSADVQLFDPIYGVVVATHLNTDWRWISGTWVQALTKHGLVWRDADGCQVVKFYRRRPNKGDHNGR